MTSPLAAGEPGWFVGFIEHPEMSPSFTRIAFTLSSENDLEAAANLVRAAGGRAVEYSSDDNYPAFFFEDPVGTRLEFCARRPRR